MDNEEIQGKKFSEFPSVTPGSADEVVGLHAEDNARFTVANFILAIRQGLTNLFVPLTRTVNNKALSADITLDASDVGAVPTTREVNGHALSSDITLDASDVGAYELPSGGIPKTDLAQGVQDSLDDADSAYQMPSGGIPATDMAQGVQDSLGLADTAYQLPSGGIPSSDMASAVQTSLGKADTAYQKPSAGIPSSDMASAVQTSLGKADTAYQKPSSGIPASDLASGVIPSVPSAYTSNPAMDGTASPGSSGAWAKGDHVHPSDTSKANQAQLATVESSNTASRAYAEGEYFCWNGLLYRVTAVISSGDTFTPGTNCEQKYATGMAVRWVDISGTSGGSSAVDVTGATGLRPSNALILSVFDKNATVNAALSLVFYPSGDRYGASLVNKAGANQATTAFSLRIMYASI